MEAIKIFIFSAKNIYLILISSSNFIYTFPVLAQQEICTNSWVSSPTEKTVCFHQTSNFGVTASNKFRSTDSTQILLERAFIEQKSNIQVTGEGRVIKLLPDDLDGDRHQRFIIRLTSGQTLLSDSLVSSVQL
jgi:hypothetical protein